MSYLIVGNWKMYLTYAQAVAWAHLHQQELQSLARETKHELVLCPSYDAISDIYKMLEKTKITVGAQDCAPHNSGAYTGQVSATSLKEIGCSYCIIGHSETRLYQHVDNKIVAHKMEQALKNHLTPIVCIGEHKNQYEAKETFHVIAEQLAPVLLAYKNHKGPSTRKLAQGDWGGSNSAVSNTTGERLTVRPDRVAEQRVEGFERLIIAYEPVWSIGTGTIPDNKYLHDVYEFIKSLCQEVGLQRTPLLLYGGSVEPGTVKELCKVAQIEGFLIGGASTDFQKLKKIVKLV